MIERVVRIIKFLVFSVLCLILTFFVLVSLFDNVLALVDLPNYNYIPDIKKLKEEGKLKEAYELAQYVTKNPDLPEYLEAQKLAEELDKEINSFWGRAKRVVNGFIFGSGDSIEEIVGGMASDLIAYGDVRDLVKQGYYKITGKETDAVIVALASIGLLTEFVDIADWVPSILKAFRKVKSITNKFADFIISSCKKSAKAMKLDDSLGLAFKNIQKMVDKVGMSRGATIMKHIDTPLDLDVVVKMMDKNSDAVYLAVKNGGSDGIDVIKKVSSMDNGVDLLSMAGKKGPAGIQFLKKGGIVHRYAIITRVGARLAKNIYLGRVYNLWKAQFSLIPKQFRWGIFGILLLATVFCFYNVGKEFWKIYHDIILSRRVKSTVSSG